MKKSLIILLAALICFCCSAPALGAGGGAVYSTDIMAYVDGHPIPSYNIGGRTCVCVEDLAWFGFDIGYDNSTRTLTADACLNENNYKFDDLERGSVGSVAGRVYSTDIKTYINGVLAENSYNIGGRTCVCIEDIGLDGRYLFGYDRVSEYGMTYYWDKDERAISLKTNVPEAGSGPWWSLPTGENARWAMNADEADVLGFECSYDLSGLASGGAARLCASAGSRDYLGDFTLQCGRDGLVLSFTSVYRGLIFNDALLADLSRLAAWRNQDAVADAAGSSAQLSELVRLKVNGETVTARGVETTSGNNTTYYSIYFDMYWYPETEITTVSLSAGTLEGTSVYERSRTEELMSRSEPLDVGVVYSGVGVYINDVLAPAYLTDDGTPYISAESLKPFGFRVKYDYVLGTAEITSPLVVPTELPQVEMPFTYVTDFDGLGYARPGDVVMNFTVYGEAFKTTVDGVSVPSVYIYGDIELEDTPCVSVFDLAEAGGYYVDTATDPMKVMIYTPGYDPETHYYTGSEEILSFRLDESGDKFFKITVPPSQSFGAVTDCELLEIPNADGVPETAHDGDRHTYFQRLDERRVLSLTITGPADGESLREAASMSVRYYDLTLEYSGAATESAAPRFTLPDGMELRGSLVYKGERVVGILGTASYSPGFYRSEQSAVTTDLSLSYHKYKVLEALGSGLWLSLGTTKTGHPLFGVYDLETASSDTEAYTLTLCAPSGDFHATLALLAEEVSYAEVREMGVEMRAKN